MCPLPCTKNYEHVRDATEARLPPDKLNGTNEPGNRSVRLIASVRSICYSHSDFSGEGRHTVAHAELRAALGSFGAVSHAEGEGKKMW